MKELKRYLKILRNAWVLLPIVSWSQIGKFLFFSKKPFDRRHPAVFAVQVKTCDEMTVWLRQMSAVDRDVFRYVFHNQYHLPPVTLTDAPVILDLGANIGLTIRHYQHLYPNARIIGYEMDTANFDMTQRNCQSLTQCTLVNTAVWKETGHIAYQSDTEEDAYHINTTLSQGSAVVTAPATSISDILKNNNLSRVDFIKMDIEGAEKDILEHPDRAWMQYVGSINMEIHDTDFFQSAIQILENEGFECKKDHRHWSAILAVRPSFFS
jgi:FkbM family methyltransferase